MITLEKIENISFDWLQNRILYPQDFTDLCEAARRGVDASVCPDCTNTFHQPFKCVTCGAQKLYDATLLDAQQRAEKAEAELAAIKAAQPSAISETVSVPREPTDAILEAIWGRPLTANDTGARKIARTKYADMLAAAQEGK